MAPRALGRETPAVRERAARQRPGRMVDGAGYEPAQPEAGRLQRLGLAHAQPVLLNQSAPLHVLGEAGILGAS